jgi:hypothetical protein
MPLLHITYEFFGARGKGKGLRFFVKKFITYEFFKNSSPMNFSGRLERARVYVFFLKKFITYEFFGAR